MYIYLRVKSVFVQILICALVVITTACVEPSVRVEQATTTGSISNTRQVNEVLPSVKSESPTVTPSPLVTLLSPAGTSETTKIAEPATITPAPTNTRKVPTQTPSLPKISLNNIAQIGGDLTAITLVEDIAFVGEGVRLAALQIDSDGTVEKIGNSNLLPGVVKQVIVFDGTAIVVAGNYVVRLSIEDPTNITIVSDLDLGQMIKDSVVHNGFLYVLSNSTVEDSVLSSINIADTLRLVDTVLIRKNGKNLALVAETLFVSHSDTIPLSIIDVSNPSNLNPISADVDLPSESIVLAMEGFGIDTLLVTTDKSDIIAFDVSTPLEPKELWREEYYEILNVTEFKRAGDKLILKGVQPAGTYIPKYDLFSLPSSLSPSTYLHSSTIANDEETVYIVDNYLLVFLMKGTELMMQAYAFAPTNFGLLAMNLNSLYTFDGTLKEWQLPSLDEVRTSSFTSEDSLAFGLGTLSIARDKIVITSDYELRVAETNDINLIGSYSSTEDPMLLFQQSGRRVEPAINKDVVYVQQLAITGQEELGRYDIGDIDDIRLLEPLSLPTNYRIAAMVANDQWLAVSLCSITDLSGNDRIMVYDLNKNPMRPEIELVVEIAPTEMIINEEILITGSSKIDSNKNQIALFQLPTLNVLEHTNSEPVQDIILVEDVILVSYRTTNYVEGFSFSVASSSLLERLGILATVGTSVDMVASDKYLVLGNQETGLFVFEIVR